MHNSEVSCYLGITLKWSVGDLLNKKHLSWQRTVTLHLILFPGEDETACGRKRMNLGCIQRENKSRQAGKGHSTMEMTFSFLWVLKYWTFQNLYLKKLREICRVGMKNDIACHFGTKNVSNYPVLLFCVKAKVGRKCHPFISHYGVRITRCKLYKSQQGHLP